MQRAPLEVSEKVQDDRRRPSRHPFYTSNGLALTARDAGHVSVELVLADLAPFGRLAAPFGPEKEGDASATAGDREVLDGAVREIGLRLAAEVQEIVVAYRIMLRESLATAEDPELLSALDRARLQERLLAATPMVDQAQACELLGLSKANPSATLKRKEDRREILRFTMDGRAVYPLFQFDVESRRPYPAVASMLSRKPKGWSDFRLLHWLTRQHLDMDGTPAGCLGDEHAVLAAFDREIELPVHG